MVPLQDLFNSSQKPNVRWVKEEVEGRSGYYIRARRNIKRGEELFNNYFRLDLKSTLIRNGFYDPAKEKDLQIMLYIDI